MALQAAAAVSFRDWAAAQSLISHPLLEGPGHVPSREVVASLLPPRPRAPAFLGSLPHHAWAEPPGVAGAAAVLRAPRRKPRKASGCSGAVELFSFFAGCSGSSAITMRRHRYLLERGAADAPAEAEGEGCGAPEGSKRGPLCVCCRRRRPHRDWLYESYYCMSQQHPLLVFLLLIVIGACLALLAVFFFASGLVSCLSLRVALFGGQRNLPPPRGSVPSPALQSPRQTCWRWSSVSLLRAAEFLLRELVPDPAVWLSFGPPGLAQDLPH